MNFQDAAAFIESLDLVGTSRHSQAYHFERGIARAAHLLERLGGAPAATTRCVIVTGSKGKGSTVAMIASMVAAAGHDVGTFTGPHLYTPTERFAIRFGRQPGAPQTFMPEAQFVAYAAEIARIVETWDRPDIGAPTRFEAYTAMAYRWFEESGMDLTIAEVGIGGRLDAVNLAEPMISVFTNISLEHTQMLGDRLADIAMEKSGIMRRAGHAVFAQQEAEAAGVLVARAAEIGSSYVFAEEGWHCHPISHEISSRRSGQWFSVALGTRTAELFLPLLGKYQLQNAAAALATVDALRTRGYDIPSAAIRDGLARTRWPGRFDILGFEPLVIADGAHTPYSMQQLAASLREYFPQRRIHFVLGVLRDKDTRGIVEAALREAATVTFTQPHNRRAMSAMRLLEQAAASALASGVAMHSRDGVRDAITLALALAAPDDVICITGSLHTVAEAGLAASAAVLSRR